MFQDNSVLYVALGLVVLLGIAVFLFVQSPSLFQVPLGTTPTPSGGGNQFNDGDITIAQAQQVVMPKSKLQLRAITKATDIPLSSAPQLFRDVVPSDAKNVLAKRLTDRAGKTGYMLIFDLSVPLQTANRIVLLEFGQTWKVVLNTHTSVFGLLELTGHNYDVQVQMSAVQDQQTKVVIRAQAQ